MRSNPALDPHRIAFDDGLVPPAPIRFKLTFNFLHGTDEQAQIGREHDVCVGEREGRKRLVSAGRQPKTDLAG